MQSENEVLFGWPLSGIKFDFDASSDKIYGDFSLPSISKWDLKQSMDGVRMGVFIDNALEPSTVFKVTPFDKDTSRLLYSAAETRSRDSDVVSSMHTIEVLRLSEDDYASGATNSVIFGGVDVETTSETGLKAVSPSSYDPDVRRLMFVGDSDTAGFGMHSHPWDWKCLTPQRLWGEIVDASLTWSRQLSLALNAEITGVNAISGVGLYSDYGQQPWATYIDRALPFSDLEVAVRKREPKAVVLSVTLSHLYGENRLALREMLHRKGLLVVVVGGRGTPESDPELEEMALHLAPDEIVPLMRSLVHTLRTSDPSLNGVAGPAGAAASDRRRRGP